jgi:1-deoxy-D-xylulose-5-phosphate synthase
MDQILSTIQSPQDLSGRPLKELEQLAGEMREALCRLLGTRSAHFASNLGVVELTLALHTTFDFRRDRLIWDTGHQVYPHKMITGRYHRFGTIRSKGGLMGYPNPEESPYDLFMTGHAGCSVSSALGLKCGDDMVRPDDERHVVAVIGDGALASGVVFEGLNNTGGLKKNLTVVLNDNKMSICSRVGSVSDYLDRLRMTSFYTGLKTEIQRVLKGVPVFGDPVERFLAQFRDALKAGILGGMLFEDLGFRYLGPVDGHNILQLQKYLAMTRTFDGPVLLHVVTEKGHGFKAAVEDPTSFHAPAPFAHRNGSEVAFRKSPSKPSYTRVARDAILSGMRRNPRVAVITAAMCQGNMLEPAREEFPDRFFDVGICESHAVAFAAGLAKAGMRPIVDVYSTFMQRSYDQIFQEVSLQDLPVVLMLDRAGLVGPDGPTHHGVFDLAFLRSFPNLVVMAPGDTADMNMMVEFAITHGGPTAIRYPKAVAEAIDRPPCPLELGRAEVIRPGGDGMLIACGGVLGACLAAADELREEGVELGVINARFVKPLDTETILPAVAGFPMVLTVEESSLMGGFGSAVLEAASDAGLDAGHVRRLGIPDRYIEHGERSQLLADLDLDAQGIARVSRRQLARTQDRLAMRRQGLTARD